MPHRCVVAASHGRQTAAQGDGGAAELVQFAQLAPRRLAAGRDVVVGDLDGVPPESLQPAAATRSDSCGPLPGGGPGCRTRPTSGSRARRGRGRPRTRRRAPRAGGPARAVPPNARGGGHRLEVGVGEPAQAESLGHHVVDQAPPRRPRCGSSRWRCTIRSSAPGTAGRRGRAPWRSGTGGRLRAGRGSCAAPSSSGSPRQRSGRRLGACGSRAPSRRTGGAADRARSRPRSFAGRSRRASRAQPPCGATPTRLRSPWRPARVGASCRGRPRSGTARAPGGPADRRRSTWRGGRAGCRARRPRGRRWRHGERR